MKRSQPSTAASSRKFAASKRKLVERGDTGDVTFAGTNGIREQEHQRDDEAEDGGRFHHRQATNRFRVIEDASSGCRASASMPAAPIRLSPNAAPMAPSAIVRPAATIETTAKNGMITHIAFLSGRIAAPM